MKPFTKFFFLLSFALAMGYLESSVVVYLRALYYPDGFNFPMRQMAPDLAMIELYRELATIVMIFSVSYLAAERKLHRFAWFLFIFSVWDLAYYFFLKVLINWPSSLFTTDILFLLPSIWTGPVIAPVINSITMLLLAKIILANKKRFTGNIRISKYAWLLLMAGSILVLISYMKDFADFMSDYSYTHPMEEMSRQAKIMFLSTKFVPESFNWLVFGSGVSMHLAAISLIIINKRKSSDRYKNRQSR